MLTQERLKELLHYNPDTGIFTWALPTNKKFKPGQIAGCLNAGGYFCIGMDGKNYLSHRLAWLYVYGKWPNNEIDHKDGNTKNNIFKNLRDATKNINQQNQRKPRKDNTSGFLGVTWCKKHNAWIARIGINGTRKHIGVYQTAKSAYDAYLAMKRKIHLGNTL